LEREDRAENGEMGRHRVLEGVLKIVFGTDGGKGKQRRKRPMGYEVLSLLSLGEKKNKKKNGKGFTITKKV